MDEFDEMIRKMFKSLFGPDATITEVPLNEEGDDEKPVVLGYHIIPLAGWGGPLPESYVNPYMMKTSQVVNKMRGGVIRDVDIVDFEDKVIVTLDVPGVDLKDITMELSDPQTLKISARRVAGERENISVRAMLLPVPVIMEKGEVALNHGVLEVRMRKASAPSAT